MIHLPMFDPEPIKMLSIRQPWASLIASGQKDVENREWRTRYRGRVLIHASRGVDPITKKEFERRFGLRALELKGPQGGVLGIAEIIDCVTRHDSKWFVGKYGFVIVNARVLPFYRCNGSLGLRDAPDDVLHFYRQHL